VSCFGCFQRLDWHYSDGNSGAVVQYVGVKVVCFGVVNGQTAAAHCLSVCIGLWHLCTADCFLNITHDSVIPAVDIHRIF